MTPPITSHKRRQRLRDGSCLFEQILDPGLAEADPCDVSDAASSTNWPASSFPFPKWRSVQIGGRKENPVT